MAVAPIPPDENPYASPQAVDEPLADDAVLDEQDMQHQYVGATALSVACAAGCSGCFVFFSWLQQFPRSSAITVMLVLVFAAAALLGLFAATFLFIAVVGVLKRIFMLFRQANTVDEIGRRKLGRRE